MKYSIRGVGVERGRAERMFDAHKQSIVGNTYNNIIFY